MVFIAVTLSLSSASAGKGKYQTGRGKRRRWRYPGWAYVPSDNPAGKLWWDRRTGHRHSTTYNNPRQRHHPALCSRWNHPAACRSTGRPGFAGCVCQATGSCILDFGQHRTIPALRLKHRSGSCGTASALPKCSIRHPVLSALLAWHLPHLAHRIGT